MPDLRPQLFTLLVLASCWAEKPPAPPARPSPTPENQPAARPERHERPSFAMNPIDGWHCLEAALPDNQSECMKSASSCERLRTTIIGHGLSAGECREQPVAWCVTFRRLKNKPEWTHLCKSTPADCMALRTKLNVPGTRVDGVSECGSWR